MILLSRAMLCQDCDTVSDTSRNCPACSGGSLLSISRVLNRKPKPELPPEAPWTAWRLQNWMEGRKK